MAPEITVGLLSLAGTTYTITPYRATMNGALVYY